MIFHMLPYVFPIFLCTSQLFLVNQLVAASVDLENDPQCERIERLTSQGSFSLCVWI